MSLEEMAVMPPDDDGFEEPAAEPVRAPRAPRRPTRDRLAEPDGPRVRLGITWALVTGVAMIGGPVWVAVWLAPTAALATGSALRTWRPRDGSRPAPSGSDVSGSVQPPVLMAAAGATLITLAAGIGPVPAATAAVAVAIAVIAGAGFGPRGVPDAPHRVVIVLLPAAAAGGLVLSRAQSPASGLALFGMICVYDSGAYLIGTGARYRWEGPVAGLASVAALTLLIAAILAPPFRGAAPWILGGLVALTAPLGPVVARRLVGDGAARVPALRRLDTLLVLGPVWVAAAALLARQ